MPTCDKTHRPRTLLAISFHTYRQFALVKGRTIFMSKFFPGVPDYVRGWYRLRTERKSMLMATDELSHSQDGLLSDIGISRDEVTCAFQSGRKNPNSRLRGALDSSLA